MGSVDFDGDMINGIPEISRRRQRQIYQNRSMKRKYQGRKLAKITATLLLR